MRRKTTSKLMPLLLLLLLTIVTPLTFAQEESEFNWSPGGNSLQWTDPTNWNNQNEDDENASTPGGPEAVVNIGGGSPAFLNGGGGGGILLLNIGNGGRLDIETGFLSFGPRTAARPFSMQNSGVLNVVGDTAEIYLRDQVANFSPASINLDDGGKINIVDGDTTINTSNLDTGNGSITMGTNTEITGSIGTTLAFVKQTIEGQGNIGDNRLGLVFDADSIVDANVGGQTLVVDGDNTLGVINQGTMQASGGGNLRLGSGPIDNTNGTIEALAGSSVDLASGFNLFGGTLRDVGTGSSSISGSGTLADITLEGTSLVFDGGSDLSLNGVINNQGDIKALNPGNANTDFVIDGATRLEGGGTITLEGASSAQSRITDYSGADGVLTNVDNTIQGTGAVGTGTVQIINESGGTVDANATGQSLTLGPVTGSAMVNRGLLGASNGGTLVFGGGQYDNAGGLIEVQDGSTINLGVNATIAGGTFRDMGTLRSTNTATLKDLTLEGSLEIAGGDDLRLDGAINNQGEIRALNPGNANTDLVIDGATRLEGGGKVTLAGPSQVQSRIVDYSGDDGVLTNVDNTIEGRGSVGANSVQVINESGGTITGNDAGGTLSLGVSAANTSINRGLITSSDSGTLKFTSGDFDNSAGLVEAGNEGTVTVGGTATVIGGLFNAADGGTIKFADTGSISNALLQSSGSGAYQADSGVGSLIDSTNQSSITVSGGADLRLSGVITNEGDIMAFNPGNANTDLVIDGATRLEGGGTITLAGPNSLSRVVDYSDSDGVLTNVDNTIQGTGSLGSSSVQIVNESGGTVDANAMGQSLTLNPVAGSAMINRGRLTASNGGSLLFGAGQYDNAGGLIDVQDGATISLGVNATISGGVFRSLGTGTVRSINSATLKDLTLEGNLEIALGDDLRLDGTISNLGDLMLRNPGNANTELVIDGSTRLEGGGTITLAGGSSVQSQITDYSGADGVLTNVDNTIQGHGRVGAGVVDIENLVQGVILANESGSSLVVDSSAATFDNFGTLAAKNSSTLDVRGITNNFGIVDAEAGSEVTFETLVNGLSGQLVGDGVIDASDQIVNNGTISPGNSPGLLTLDSDLLLGSTGTLEIELASMSSFDELIINGDLELGGSLELVLLDGYTPGETEIFDVVMADVVSGFFDNVSDGGRLLTTDGTGSFQVNYGSGGTVQLSSFSAVPEPGSAVVLIAAGVALLTRRRRASAFEQSLPV